MKKYHMKKDCSSNLTYTTWNRKQKSSVVIHRQQNLNKSERISFIMPTNIRNTSQTHYYYKTKPHKAIKLQKVSKV